MKNQPSKTITFLLTAGCFFAFFLFGFTDNLKGPTLPPMLEELGINYGTGGNIFFSLYFGFLIATLITGILADRLGLKVVMLLAGVMLAIGVGGYSSLDTPALLSISLFVIGLGLGGFELGTNAVIVNLHHEKKGLYLNLTGVMHGLGSTVAPVFAGWMLTQGSTWRTIYRWDLLLIAAFILYMVFLRFPSVEEKSSLEFSDIPKAAFKGHMPLFYLAILFYVSAEIGVGSWMVLYLQEIRGVSIELSSQALAFFFAALMIGRLIGGFFVHKLGYLRSILVAATLGSVSLAIGIFTDLSIFLPLTGLFFSIIFPTITAAVSDTHHENLNTVLGVLFTFAGIGGMIGPWLAAWSSEFFGLQNGFTINLLLSLFTVFFIFILLRRNGYEKSS
jgi:MFS transporter, FHS family, glucose/mannose:H+ symporter